MIWILIMSKVWICPQMINFSFTECDCPDPKKHTGNCEVGTGKCECAEAYRGADDCSKCADG